MAKYLSVARILNFHGIKGEAKVGYTKGKEDQLLGIKTFLIEKEGKEIFLTVERVRFHKQHAIIKFKEINSVEEVQALKNETLKAEKTFVQEYLEDDEYLIDDLVGLDVYNMQEEYIGKIKYLVSQTGSELLSIEDKNKKQHLVPFVKKLVPVVDLKKQLVVIDEIPGLIER
ncbi:MAG: ribosome maturation factor RimM [Candidatus Gastranaerophilales bacterium]|jgi:16S rRNA processing protein RimM|nr:ribosome maturation factor RimM [Candidatus Gastranaerophilales bacterium]